MIAEGDVRTARLPCEIGRGLFSNERSIRVTLPEGRHVTALVHQRDVQAKQEPSEDGVVPGWVAVWVIAEEGPLTVVDLPQPGFEGGPRLRVPTAWLK